VDLNLAEAMKVDNGIIMLNFDRDPKEKNLLNFKDRILRREG